MRVQDGQIRVSLPEGFDAAAVLSAAGVDRKWVPHAEFMVGDVCNWRRFYRRSPDEYQPYSVLNFRAGVPKDAIAALTRAVVPAVLEWKDGGKYRFGTEEPGRCREYRLAPEYRHRTLVNHAVRSHSIWSRVRGHDAARRRQAEAQAAAMPPVFRTLREMEHQYHLTGDSLSTGHPIVSYLSDGEDSRPRWFQVCEYGRVHHPTGVCPRRLRPWLAVRSSPHSVHQCDVSGSQLLLTALWVLGLIPPAAEAEIAGRGEEKRGKRKERASEDWLLSGQSRGVWKDEVQILEDLITGVMRAKVVAEVNRERESQNEPPLSADAVKLEILSAVFGRWEFVASKVAGRALLRLYPNFMNLWAERVKAMPHGELARRMQRVESGIMLHGAAARLIRERPGVSFVTIHDAILCEQPYIADAVTAVKDEWEAAVGVAPLVKQSSLTHAEAA